MPHGVAVKLEQVGDFTDIVTIAGLDPLKWIAPQLWRRPRFDGCSLQHFAASHWAARCYALLNPVINFAFDPSDTTLRNRYSAWKPIPLHIRVNCASTQAGT